MPAGHHELINEPGMSDVACMLVPLQGDHHVWAVEPGGESLLVDLTPWVWTVFYLMHVGGSVYNFAILDFSYDPAPRRLAEQKGHTV